MNNMITLLNNARNIGMYTDLLLSSMTTVQERTQYTPEIIIDRFCKLFTRINNIRLHKATDDNGDDLSSAENILEQNGYGLFRNNGEFWNFTKWLYCNTEKLENESLIIKCTVIRAIAGMECFTIFAELIENYNTIRENTDKLYFASEMLYLALDAGTDAVADAAETTAQLHGLSDVVA